MNSNWSYSPETAKLGCDLCDLDLWPWSFAWTLLWSLVITPENFMIRWWEHSQKCDRQTDGRTDGQTENTICRAAWSQLKKSIILTKFDDNDGHVAAGIYPYSYLACIHDIRSPMLPLISEWFPIMVCAVCLIMFLWICDMTRLLRGTFHVLVVFAPNLVLCHLACSITILLGTLLMSDT